MTINPRSIDFTSLTCIDTHDGIFRIGGSEYGYLRCLQVFYHSLDCYKMDILNACAEGNLEKLHLHTHNLYGVSITIGASPLAGSCLSFLERSACSSEERIKELIGIVLSEIVMITKCLGSFKGFYLLNDSNGKCE